MGCTASDEFDEPLSEDLENEMNFRGYDKQDGEVDRFASNKPEEGFVSYILFQDEFFGAAEEDEEQFMATKPWIGALVAPTESISVIRPRA